MGWPQVTYIILLALNLWESLMHHGERKEGRYNFWVGLFSTGITVWILFCGGFFR